MADGWYQQDPLEVQDYSVDWAKNARLEPGETLTASIWDVPAGLEQVNEPEHEPPRAPHFDDTTATVWIRVDPGAAGVFAVVNRVTTSAGRQYTEVLHIVVDEP